MALSLKTDIDETEKVLWRVETWKWDSGEIRATLYEYERTSDGMLRFALVGAFQNITARRPGRATEKAVREVHAEGCAAAKAIVAERRAALGI